MIINRVWAMPNKWTFTIKPIKELLERYVGDGKNWIDPFAGEYSPAEFTNDINPERKTTYHLDSLDFCKMLSGKYTGILFDPPYSYRQISEHYKASGRKVTSLDTSSNFFTRVIKEISPKIQQNGFVISCGWNSGGFGKKYGFEILEVLLVCHSTYGIHHNDTIVTVEQKIKNVQKNPRRSTRQKN